MLFTQLKLSPDYWHGIGAGAPLVALRQGAGRVAKASFRQGRPIRWCVGPFLLGAPNPALDAARLDIMPPVLWGRAEAVRTALRSLLEAAAPLLFGYVSQYVFGGPGSGTAESGTSSSANSTGLEYTFLLFLVTLSAAGLLALAGLRTYPHDVATAAASTKAIGRDQHV